MTRTARRTPPTRTSPGQTIVLFALMSLVLLGALGLALDGGYDYIQRRAMQNAADAAALAGAGGIARGLTDTAVTQLVLDTAARNGVNDPSLITCTFITNNYTVSSPGITRACTPVGGGGVAMSSYSDNFTGVLVRAIEQHPTFMFRALGIATSGTAAISAARVQRPTGIVGGPFMVCGVGTTVTNRNVANFSGGIYATDRNYSVTGSNNRTDGLDDCQGGRCARVPDLDGAPTINDGAYAYADASLTPIYDAPATPHNVVVGPVYLIHDPQGINHGQQGINPCNINSSSFNGVNTNAIAYNFTTYPAYSRDTNPPTFNGAAKLPPLTTGNVSSVQAAVNGINGCQAGQTIDNCIMILPVCVDSGPGGRGSNAVLAVRSLQAFYVRQIATGSHTGELIKNYTITANSDPTYVTGTGGVTVLKTIR